MNIIPRAVDPEVISQQCRDAVELHQHRHAQDVAGDAIAFNLGMLHAVEVLRQVRDSGTQDRAAVVACHAAVLDAVLALQNDAERFFSGIG